MSKINRSIINMLSGAVGYVIPMILNLAFTPIIVSKLGHDAFGLQSLVNVIIGYLMIADMGLDIPVTRYIAEYNAKGDNVRMVKLLSSTLQLYLIIGLSGMVIIFGLSHWLVGSVFRVPSELHSDALIVFLLAGIGFLGGIMSMWGKSIFNGLQRYEIANGISVVSNFLSSVIGIILVIYGYGVIGYVFVRVLFSFVSSLLYFYFGKRFFADFKITFGIDMGIWLLLKAQIGYGFILRISGILFSRLDQTLIGAWIGLAAVGVYAIPFLITSSMLALIGSLIHFVFPMASALHSTNKTEELKSVFFKTSRFVAIISSLLFMPLLLFGDKFLTLWVGKEISDEGRLVLLFLTLANYSIALSNLIINSFIVGIGQLRFFTIYAITKGIIMGLGCALFIKPYGIAGAGVAMIVSCVPDYIFFLVTTKKFLQLSAFELIIKAYFKPVFLSLFLGFGFFFMRPLADTWFGLVAVCTIFIFIYLGMGFIIKMYDETEKRIFSALWNTLTVKVKIKQND